MKTGGLLSIFAHPDDETFGVGGTMARYAERGVPVTMVCATRGEVGEIAKGSPATPETLGQYREQELRDAMAILGVTDVRFLDYRDSGMKGTDDNHDPRAFMNADATAVVPALVRIIRERRPDVIVTWDESGGYGHPDHVATHFHATAAFREAGDPSNHRDLGEAWAGASLFYTAIPIHEFSRVMDEMRNQGIDVPEFVGDEISDLPRVDPNCIIDVSAFFERKIRAMLAHSSQITDEDPFMRMPEDIQRSFFGREYFHRAHPAMSAGMTLSDLLG
jgi:N-acetyl-1-D-myo-inositol-2-amino-2-deoxy-alpha-D-glucopyranoside deacetylase